MAASQNLLQGSLFEGGNKDDTKQSENTRATQASPENLTNQQLKADALLRPRLPKKTENQIPTEIGKLESKNFDEIEEPKWSHQF